MSSKLEKYQSQSQEIDELIQKYSSKLLKLRENKKKIEMEMIQIIKNNNLYNRNIKLTRNNCSIKLVEIQKRENISQKLIKNALQSFFQKKMDISPQSIFNFIINSRKLNKSQELKVKYH